MVKKCTGLSGYSYPWRYPTNYGEWLHTGAVSYDLDVSLPLLVLSRLWFTVFQYPFEASLWTEKLLSHMKDNY
jgi:hypothetical protein